MHEDESLLRTSRELFIATMAGEPARVDSSVIDAISSALEEDEVKAGTKIFSAGEPADFLYFMRDGRAKMTVENGTGWVLDGRWVFGGLEALLDRPHLRTAVALTDLHLLRLRADVWLYILESHFDLARAIVRNVSKSVAGLEVRKWALKKDAHGDRITNPPTGPGPLQLIDWLAMLSDMPMFRHAGVQVLADLAGLVEEVTLEPGDALFSKEGRDDEMLILMEGEVVAHHKSSGNSVVYGPGSSVCEFAILGELVEDWSARVTRKARLLTLSLDDWFDLMEEHFDLLRSALAALADVRDALIEELAAQTKDLTLR
jgi:CRP-like cAMP-binding protein